MPVTRKEVEHIAELARLHLTEQEIDEYTLQLNNILEYVDKLNELNTENIKPLSHPIEGVNIFRDDKVKSSVKREDALKNAPSKDDEFFKVPKVIGGD